MKKFEIPEPKDYQSFINFYRNVMREGKEEEAFFRHRCKISYMAKGFL